ncbi:hypothetical protein LCGC14_0231520 [marine sediment metagenome]|uniref:Uncharacterized protein n=1 Tax=marine sediment metagenome TaxID=412755 RepID=A0A0F9UEF2_9ZZZZ
MPHWTHTMTEEQHKALSDAMYDHRPATELGEVDRMHCKSCVVPGMHSRFCTLTAALDKTPSFEEGMQVLEKVLKLDLDGVMWGAYNAQTGEDGGGNFGRVLAALESLPLLDDEKVNIANRIAEGFTTPNQIREWIDEAMSQPQLKVVSG